MQQNVETKQLLTFGLLVGGIFSVIGLWPIVFREEPPRTWALACGAILILLGLVLPHRLKPVYRVWMKIGQVLGWINTRIILGVIFYGLLTPMGLVMRLFGKDAMHSALTQEATTYRLVRTPRSRSHMRHQF